MTTLEQLVADHANLIQRIITEAKKEALAGIITNTPNINLDQKLDLFSHISSNFDNLIKDLTCSFPSEEGSSIKASS